MPSPTISEYELAKLEAATDGFSNDRRIGGGGSGDVFSGRLGDTDVAIASYQGAAEFIQEVQAQGGAMHENLVPIYGFCAEPLCLVYPLKANGSLSTVLLERPGELSPVARLRAAAGVARGAAVLHAQQRGHRDIITSSNILLDHAFNPALELADVGLVREMAPAAGHTVTDAGIAGTYHYLPPECQEMSTPLSPLSDVYSLGVVFLELLTGEPVYSRELSPPGLVDRVHALRRSDPGVVAATAAARVGWTLASAEGLLRVAMACLSDDRPSAADACTDLERLAAACVQDSRDGGVGGPGGGEQVPGGSVDPSEAAAARAGEGGGGGDRDSAADCVVCHSMPRGVRLLCGHAVMCDKCAILVSAQRMGCPICRDPYVDGEWDEGAFDEDFVPPTPSSRPPRARARAPQDPEVNVDALQESWNLDHVLATMRAHAGSARVQEGACRALERLIPMYGMYISAGESRTMYMARVAERGVIEAVVAAMRAHRGSAGVQQWACLALMTITRFAPDESIKMRAAEGGAIEAVVAAVSMWAHAHGGSWNVLHCTCEALTSITEGSDESRRVRAAEAGAIEAVVAAMRAVGGSAEVQEYACRVLVRITSGTDESMKMRAAEGGAIEAVVAAMRAHGGSAGVQENACWALAAITGGTDESRRVRAAEGGAMEAVVAAMRAHGGSAGVQYWACWALAAITAGSDERRTLRAAESGAIEAIKAAMRAHRALAGVVGGACKALGIIGWRPGPAQDRCRTSGAIAKVNKRLMQNPGWEIPVGWDDTDIGAAVRYRAKRCVLVGFNRWVSRARAQCLRYYLA